MKNNKMDILVMTINVSDKTKTLSVESAGKHRLTFKEIKDTLHDSIDLQFEEFEEKLDSTGKEFDNGVIILPLIKINYKKEGVENE